jgi:hypothetical protein
MAEGRMGGEPATATVDGAGGQSKERNRDGWQSVTGQFCRLSGVFLLTSLRLGGCL